MKLKIESHLLSGLGPKKQMQDAGIYKLNPDNKNFWSIVCDGIGGQPGGAEAANICVSEYDKYLTTSKARMIVSNTINFLKIGLLPVVDAFVNHVKLNQVHKNMGCTLTLAYIEGNKAIFGWCGDSRIYLFRNGTIHFKSLPHNISFDLFREGKISLSAAEKKKTNIITRSISADSAFPIVDFEEIELNLHDRILVCTDGVWNKLNRSDFNNIAKSKNFKETINQIENKLSDVADDNFFGWCGMVSENQTN
jgi:protein phosphatase